MTGDLREVKAWKPLLRGGREVSRPGLITYPLVRMCPGAPLPHSAFGHATGVLMDSGGKDYNWGRRAVPGSVSGLGAASPAVALYYRQLYS